MQPKEIFALAMNRQDVPRVPFIETSIAFNLERETAGAESWSRWRSPSWVDQDPEHRG